MSLSRIAAAGGGVIVGASLPWAYGAVRDRLKPKWSHPLGMHEYHTWIHPSKSQKLWDLKEIRQMWEKGDSPWPWVWAWRNKNGPLYLVVAAPSSGSLVADKVKRIATQSAYNNIIVVSEDLVELARTGAPEDLLMANRCGIIQSRIHQLDVQERAVLLDNEQRIIMFDELLVV
eukprot:Tamp_19574.p1 GENE.Tamp_19574~~Tamp_19574.p1  ORF type:complete len:174 (-),score=31.98 Tamp_19574:729-1250(-)